VKPVPSPAACWPPPWRKRDSLGCLSPTTGWVKTDAIELVHSVDENGKIDFMEAG
jgi:hypothetical protein